MRVTTPNARFWVRVNGGFVKLTLRPGQELEHYAWERTDEGFESQWSVWAHLGYVVAHQWAQNSRDCDGRLHRSGRCYARLSRLYAHQQWYGRLVDGELVRIIDQDAPPLPIWEGFDESQRDYAAEAAGY